MWWCDERSDWLLMLFAGGVDLVVFITAADEDMFVSSWSGDDVVVDCTVVCAVELLVFRCRFLDDDLNAIYLSGIYPTLSGVLAPLFEAIRLPCHQSVDNWPRIAN